MKFWWFADPQRLALEKQAVESIARDESWFEFTQWDFHELNLAASGVILSHGNRYPIKLIYPDQFPQVPAWVIPQNDEQWSSHQYGSGGSLCLELRPDNWHSLATGADVLRSAYHLLELENPLGESDKSSTVPSAHQIGEVQAYAWLENPVLIGANCHARLLNGKAEDLKALRWTSYDDIWPILLHDSEDRKTIRRPPEADLGTWRFEIPVYVSASSPPEEINDRESLISIGSFQSDEAEAINTTTGAVVLFTGGNQVTVFHLATESKTYRRRIYTLPEQNNIRSGRPTHVQTKRIAIVGAGSIGSKIADSLVRSGISHLTIVDGDILLPGNLERHVLDWRDVGFRKVDGIKRHLHHILPGADINIVDQNLNWQRSARTHASQIERISNCDLIVDATGDAATALFLGAIATENKLPFVSVEVFEGGIGMSIACCLPDRDPPYTQARAAFLAWCEQNGNEIPTRGERPYEAISEDGAPMIADDAAVTIAAGHAARSILDIVDSEDANPQVAWMLIGFRKAWVFEGHGHVIRLSAGTPSVPEQKSPDADTLAFQKHLVKELQNALDANR